MATVTVHEAKTHMSRLLARVEAGEEIIIARGRVEIAKLVPLNPPPPARRTPAAAQAASKVRAAWDAGVALASARSPSRRFGAVAGGGGALPADDARRPTTRESMLKSIASRIQPRPGLHAGSRPPRAAHRPAAARKAEGPARHGGAASLIYCL